VLTDSQVKQMVQYIERSKPKDKSVRLQPAPNLGGGYVELIVLDQDGEPTSDKSAFFVRGPAFFAASTPSPTPTPRMPESALFIAWGTIRCPRCSCPTFLLGVRGQSGYPPSPMRKPLCQYLLHGSEAGRPRRPRRGGGDAQNLAHAGEPMDAAGGLPRAGRPPSSHAGLAGR
jgi:hypothetical protein